MAKSSNSEPGRAGTQELAWGDLSVILAVCRAGTLSGAARSLGQNHSTIFRKINAIEEKTGVRFFERLAEGYAMTEAGQTALRYAERIEAEVHALSREVLGQDMRLQGKIRVTAPEGISQYWLPKWAADFCRLHPEVVIEVVGGHSAMDLARREADIAIRATIKPPDASLGRQIGKFGFAFYAQPAYWKKHKTQPLSEQNWCLIQGTLDWLVPLVWKKKAHGERHIVFSSSASYAVINACAEGMGVTLMPCYLADSDQRVRRVSEPLDALTLELWVLTHADLRYTARVKTMMAYLHDRLKEDEDLYAGLRPYQTARR